MPRHRTVRWTTLLLMAAFVLPLIAAGQTVATPLAPIDANMLQQTAAKTAATPLARIDPKVLQQAAAQGETTFWVELRDTADLEPAKQITDWNARGEAVVSALKATADASQKELKRLLTGKQKQFEAYWIVNTIKVTADTATIKELAARREVAAIHADEQPKLPELRPEEDEGAARIQAVEWGISRIRADQVWSTFGVRGEGIVVANIDTGVLYTHAALVNQYRGNLGNGTFDHNYNWFDAFPTCNPSGPVPCDYDGHGTHVMGTMVGDDGAGNQIGVAPRAKWIATTGSDLGSGQWLLAPTDLNGQNPRSDLRPHIVNNSWGGYDESSYYRPMVQAWVAAGIFPVFATGNGGPGCTTSASPGNYAESYAVGAFNVNNAIATFSSRGAAQSGIKPNIAAPGDNIRSALRNGRYGWGSGTSFAAPHVAGTVALIWSAVPQLIGNISATRAILDQTAVDTSDLTCGGTAGNNNVWGEGKLDAFAAVTRARQLSFGTVSGTITAAGTGAPLSGVTVQATGPTLHSSTTSATGAYTLPLPVGTYTLTVSALGWITQTITGVEITANTTITRNSALTPTPPSTVTGTVRDTAGTPIASATVSLDAPGIASVTTNVSGVYTISNVSAGRYTITATADMCRSPQTQSITVNGDASANFMLAQRSDGSRYVCEVVPFGYIEATTVLPLTGDSAVAPVNLPFPFTFYGIPYTRAYVSTNGILTFQASDIGDLNNKIPLYVFPNAAIYPFWDDLLVDTVASVRTHHSNRLPNRYFVVEWRNVALRSDPSRRIDFEVILYERGQILTQYRNLDADDYERGRSATVGIEDQDGMVALQISYNTARLTNNLAIRYRAR